jgi:cytochrome P450
MTALRPIPVRPSWPVVGDSLAYIRDAHGYLHELHARYGEACTIRAFGQRFHFLLGPDANQLVLQNQGDVFSNAAWVPLIGPFFRRGLMLLDLDEHRLHRRIMQTAFTRDALAGYLVAMQQRIDADLGQWTVRAGFRMFDALKKLTLNVGSEVFAGQAPGREADRLNRAFLDMVQAATGVIRFGVPGTRWNAGLRGRRLLQHHLEQEIPAKRAQPGSDLFSRLCQATTDDGELFSDADVINHMIFVLMAAHDTSTITLSNMIYQLAKHPQWQERLRDESRALGTPTPDFDQLGTLKTMSLVMKEALRVCAPVPGLPRRAVRDCEFKGFRIRAGEFVNISPWFTHTSPHVWKDPQRFDPERFSDERAEDKAHPFKWVPFGGGAHKCIGLFFGEMEVKAILHQMLLRYRWSVPKDYVIKQDFTSLPIPKDRLPVKLEHLHAPSN